tara:strand:+ start:4321 stop:5385 length:1065 start_codon:yes stop_codon:yes gene_type:complete
MKKKTTLIIPAAGRSSRYPNMKPKWLLTHPTGKLMIQKVLESCDYGKYDKTVITILKEHCEEYDADVILEQMFNNSVTLLILDEPTKSAAETVYQTIVQAKLSGQMTVKDSDCLVESSYSPQRDHIVGLTVNSKTEVDRLHQKSFIIKNDDNVIVDILEKEMVSNIICLGVYSTDCDDFINAYNSICDSDVYKHESEIYVSHVISYLITCENRVFEYVEADRFVDWGTANEWYKEIAKHNTYVFDIDGVLLRNCGKYGSKNWSNYFEPIEDNISILKNLSDNGNEIIFMTARTEEYLDQFKQLLKDRDIKYKTIVHGCSHSKRIIINDFAPTNPYPSCEALSIKRNDKLNMYLK